MNKSGKIILISIALVVLALIVSIFLIMKNRNIAASDATDTSTKTEVYLLDKDSITYFSITDVYGDTLDFQKEESGWVFIPNPYCTINEDEIDSTLKILSSVYANDFIDNPDLTDYGFSNSKYYYSLAIDDMTVSVTIGDRIENSNDYYFVINEDYSRVYIGGSNLVSISTKSIEDFTIASDDASIEHK